MAAASSYLESALLSAVLTNSAYTSPAQVYFALFTTDPTDAGTGAEVSGGGYARQAVSFGGSDSTRESDGQLEFTASGASFGTITHVGIFDAVSGGNLLLHGALAISRDVLDGATLTFAAGDIVAGVN